MKKFKTNTRFNTSKNQNEVNCIGFFNNDYFTLSELMVRQNEVYSMIEKDKDNKEEYSELYNTLEFMRVELLKQTNSSLEKNQPIFVLFGPQERGKSKLKIYDIMEFKVQNILDGKTSYIDLNEYELNGKTSYIALKDYVIFEGNYFNENIKILYNSENEPFLVLNFRELVHDEYFTVGLNSNLKENWREKKFICVKLDKCVRVGDTFYTQKIQK